jgi:hypothetical protein
MAELMQEIQAWKQIPDEVDLVNALIGTIRAVEQNLGWTETSAINATAKELAAKGIMARDVTTKDIPAEIMAKGVLANYMTTKTKTAVPTSPKERIGPTTSLLARPSWWKRLLGRPSASLV